MEHEVPSRLLLSFLLLIIVYISSSSPDNHRTYIIHMDKSTKPSPFSTSHSWYESTLSSLSSADGASPPTHLYTYNHVMDGFSAVLSKSQLELLQKMPGHLATYPETFGHFHTTRTPKFLGLNEPAGLWPVSGFGDDMIIGIIDSGIWPESESFNDDGMPPVPERWRGTCELGSEFNSSHCNRKLVGARSFSKALKKAGFNISKKIDYDSPRDFFGHGTHTASVAAGSLVHCADYFGHAKGTAIGMAPKARLAMYKVGFYGESEAAMASDTLAGMDQAIADGVDLMSLSIAFNETSISFDKNPIALGAFAAMEKGIFVACSAGNSGHRFLFNGAPWITTVGAGTIDRDFAGHVIFGDGEFSVTGRSIYPENLLVSGVPLYFGYGNRSREICRDGALDRKEIAGKYLFCDFNDEKPLDKLMQGIERSGAIGAIMSSNSWDAGIFSMPIVIVKPKDGELIKHYIIRSKHPVVVSIKFQITLLDIKPAPRVTGFSSRGPYPVAPWVLKPDILAPGYDILAAWVPNKAGALIRENRLLSNYRLLSGTSMSSPHLVGIAALLKAAHRDWSPAAVRSAIMTTAYVSNNAGGIITDMDTGVAATPLDFGAGHVNPDKAMNPGLVYDLEAQDYIDFLCGLNYTTLQIKIITRRTDFSCENANLDINYPSLVVILNDNRASRYTFKRVLTNVLDSKSVYRAEVIAPQGMEINVQPSMIFFAEKDSRAQFNLTIDTDLGRRPRSYYNGSFGYLSWCEVNGTHVVRSPIVSTFAP